MVLTVDDQRANDAAAARGHKVQSDPIGHATAAKRWTCTECGMAVLLYGSNIYGGALEYDCVPVPNRPVGPTPEQVGVRIPSVPGVTLADLGRMGIQAFDPAALEGDSDARIDPMSWDEGVSAMLAGSSAGAAMFQRFICAACRAIQTMPTPNRVYSVGRCEECAHLTDLRREGFGVYGIMAANDAQRAKVDDLIDVTSAEIRSRPDNFVLRARGVKVKSTPHRAPCANCGQPDHRGKPCEIAFRRRRR